MRRATTQRWRGRSRWTNSSKRSPHCGCSSNNVPKVFDGGAAVTRRLTLIASLIGIVGGLAIAQQPGPAPPKIAVLIVTGQNGHNWRGTTPLLRKILEDTGKFEVRVTEEFRGAGPETLAPYDLVVLNYFERGRPELRWGEKTDSAFLDFVRSGKGVVVYHFSMVAFDGWTEYEKLSGGTGGQTEAATGGR